MDMKKLIKLTCFFTSLVIIPATLAHDHICVEKKCSREGPSVRFPFLLLDSQPANCGYSPAFNLYCDEFKRTILQPPSSSVKFLVTKIDYLSQTMQIQLCPGDCTEKHLRYLNMSTTPFQFSTLYYLDTYSFFNCTTSKYGTKNSCLDSPGYRVFAIPNSEEIWGSNMELCTKMYETGLLPSDLFFPEASMTLNWSLPDCQRCKMHGGICGRENPADQIRCFRHSGLLKILHVVGPTAGFSLLVLVIGAIYLVYSKIKRDKENQRRIRKFLDDYTAMKPTRYTYVDIKKMTNGFKDKLGEGGNGKVFKGKVSKDISVAVKLLHHSVENGEDFINEVGTMGKIHHVNVVRLLGFCADGFKRALVYEFLPHGSLDKFIFLNEQEHHSLGMEKLQDIAIGVARGIEYLHQGCEQRILHFDIKPQNILLDENYNPKISDFGLAKLLEKGRSDVSMTTARGTMGYIAPEVFSRHFGNVSYKSDIYSFGMLLLEMVGRRKNIDTDVRNTSQVYYPEWAYGRLAKGEELRIEVEEDGEEKIAKKLAIVGLWCIQWNPVDRPSITRVLQMLEGTRENLHLPPNPSATGNSLVNPADLSVEDRRSAFGSSLAVISECEEIP